MTLSNDGVSPRRNPPANNGPLRHSSEPAIPSSTSSAPLVRHATDPVFPDSKTPQPPISRPPLQSRESFTDAGLELRPTFSPKIIRTPEDYARNGTPSRTNSGSSRSASIDSLASRFGRMNSSDSSSRSSSRDDEGTNTNPPSRQGSGHSFYSFSSGHSSSASITGVPVLVDEPASIVVPRGTGLGSSSTLHTIVEDTPRRSSRKNKAKYDGARSPSPYLADDTPRPSYTYPQYQPYQQDGLPQQQQQQKTPPSTYSQQPTPPEMYPSPRSPSRSSHPERERDHDQLRSRRRSQREHHLTTPPEAVHTQFYPSENQHPLPVPPRPNGFDVEKEREKQYAASHPTPSLPTPPRAISLPIAFNPHPNLLPSPVSPSRPSHSHSPPSHTTTDNTHHTNNTTTTNTTAPSTTGPRPVKPRLTYIPNPTPPAGALPAHLTSRIRSVRAGFWNRRGDHLTHDGYVVYAPTSMAYPADLADYPDGEEGYKDQHGQIAAWDVERGELEGSLPRRGEPPSTPYHNVGVFFFFFGGDDVDMFFFLAQFITFVSREVVVPREK